MFGTKAPKFDKETYHELNKKACGEPLKDGEQRMIVLPGFDFRGTKDNKYGQHTPTLMFAERRGDRAVDIQFYMGWSLDGLTNFSPICTGVYFHDDHKSGEYSHDVDNCNLTGGKCFGQAGSALYGDKIMARLLSEGSPAMWDEINQAFGEFDTL